MAPALTLSLASLSVPVANRACTTPRWPFMQAPMRAVLPLCTQCTNSNIHHQHLSSHTHMAEEPSDDPSAPFLSRSPLSPQVRAHASLPKRRRRQPRSTVIMISFMPVRVALGSSTSPPTAHRGPGILVGTPPLQGLHHPKMSLRAGRHKGREAILRTGSGGKDNAIILSSILI